MTKYLVDFERVVTVAELGIEGGEIAKQCEKIMRNVVAGWAKDAPLHVAIALARAAITVRRAEDKAEAEAN